ncbi:MAG: choline ABC transporter permease subunit [Candidatus Symbiobacter sp.]|nr:choline ABC transporter permease subunit [Candidatus Symbiobacter sp.]
MLEESFKWFIDHKIPLGRWMNDWVQAINDHATWLFDGIRYGLETLILGMIGGLLWFPPFILIVIFAALVWGVHRSWGLVSLTLLSLLMIANMGFWQPMIETLAMVILTTLVCLVIGVPIGIMVGHRQILFNFLRPILDLMQTIPTFVYLIPTLVLFGLGVVPGLISTVVFTLPAPIRLTYLGIISVPTPLLEAGKAFGATKRQLLWKIELPSALPSIMVGVTQSIMLSLSMVVISALVGADGLGKPVVRALNTRNLAQGFESGLAIVLLAILLDRVCKMPAASKAKQRVKLNGDKA